MTLKNNRAPLLCCFKLCASFRSNWWIQTGVTVRERSIWVRIDDIFLAVPTATLRNNNVFTTSARRRRRRVDAVKTLSLRHYCVMCPLGSDLEIWLMTMKNNITPLLSNIKLCASLHHHMWNQTGVTVPKRLNLGFDLCDLDLWPLTLTFYIDITSVTGNKISWWFDDGNILKNVWQTDRRADGQTDGQTDGLKHS